jgi:hypothetical protein
MPRPTAKLDVYPVIRYFPFLYCLCLIIATPATALDMIEIPFILVLLLALMQYTSPFSFTVFCHNVMSF